MDALTVVSNTNRCGFESKDLTFIDLTTLFEKFNELKIELNRRA